MQEGGYRWSCRRKEKGVKRSWWSCRREKCVKRSRWSFGKKGVDGVVGGRRRYEES